MNTPKKILVIEDDQNFGNALTETVGTYKYSVLNANSGSSGIQKVFEFNPDLIVCNIDCNLFEGSTVFKTLKASSSLENVPVCFLKDIASNDSIGHEISIDAHEIIAKQDNLHDLMGSIQSFPLNDEKVMEDSMNDFDRLFQLSPNGILVFKEEDVVLANDYLLNILKRNNKEAILWRLEDLFNKSSFMKIKLWISHYGEEKNSSFNDHVMLICTTGEKLEMNLIISEFKKSGNCKQFIGFLFETSQVKNSMVNYQLANDVCNMLKRENVVITDVLAKKITQIVKQRTVDDKHQNCSFFTRRENEVLRLSMEGLSIKVIADKLSISTRTVEKYRTKLMEKSGAKNIVEVIVFSLKNNLIKL